LTGKKFWKTYFFSFLLIASLLLGGLFGYFFPEATHWIKPLGDIFLNLILTTIIPLIFFSVAAAISKSASWAKLGQIFLSMGAIFLITGIITAMLSILVVKIFPISQGIDASILTPGATLPNFPIAEQLVGIFTVPEFSRLFSHHHILALILFSFLVGLAASANRDNGIFVRFLQTGEDVFMRVFAYIMYYAPIGFFAYFANLVSELGPNFMANYIKVALVYYGFGLGFFILAYSFYAYLANQEVGIKRFWRNIILPASTAVATCSSAASIPANLEAARNIGVSATIYETVIPLGTLIHKEGSIIGGVFKIAFLFGLFHMDFSGTTVLLTALGVSLLVGTVMGAIPSGGMLGELLILAIYGFPASALIAIAAISIIIDPLATMLNTVGNCSSSMLVARWVEGKNWIVSPRSEPSS
jgi:Na+/H+-dicarboxylate symporter